MSRISRSRMTFTVYALAVIAAAAMPLSVEAAEAAAEPVQLMIRCDDVGMCHGVNTAVRELAATGLRFSTSVMFACPWYREAVEILKDHPEIGVGVHLTLNSEWEHYKWGPVLGAGKVPSLVDANGHFHPTEAAFAAAGPRLDEVRMELEAQIERALASGLRIDYIDFHMLTAVSTPELQAIVEQLAAEHRLGISRYFGERGEDLARERLRAAGRPEPAQIQVVPRVAYNPRLETAVVVRKMARRIPASLGARRIESAWSRPRETRLTRASVPSIAEASF